MGLALVSVTPSDFDRIHDHLVSHRPDYRNMHLRQACQRGGRRTLRYLHAMRLAPGDARVIEGMISGPDALWEYQIIRRRTPTQVNVLTDEATERERDRIERHFLAEIMARIETEEDGFRFPPRFSRGEFYLRRHHGGMPITHLTCQQAIDEGAVDEAFLATILPWGFQLVRH